jgi:hypothetical protein
MAFLPEVDPQGGIYSYKMPRREMQASRLMRPLAFQFDGNAMPSPAHGSARAVPPMEHSEKIVAAQQFAID